MHLPRLPAALGLVVCAACAGGSPVCDPPVHLGTLPHAVGESSGLAASRTWPGVIWTHNDSGDGPFLYAVDTTGAALGRVRVRGAAAMDWEDLAAGPCDGRACLYIADTGNNARNRDTATIYLLPEPRPTDTVSAPARHLNIRYPSGTPDAEAVFVLPGPSLYVVTKGVRVPITVYRYPGPLRPGRLVTLHRVQRLSPGPVALPDQVTGATATPDGKWIALRTYTGIHFYRLARGRLRRAAGDSTGIALAALEEPQGEGISYAAGGRFFLSSERGLDTIAPLSALRCTLP